MATVSNLPPSFYPYSTLSSLSASPLTLSFPHSHCKTPSLQLRACTIRTGSAGNRVGSSESLGSDLLRKPSIIPDKVPGGVPEEEEEEEKEEEEEEEEDVRGKGNYKEESEVDKWVDWEDQILEDTVPLVGFVRMILHSDKYGSGDRLTPDHERTILERLLPYHPESGKKIGSGVDYITVGYHPDFEGSRCLFIVRKDGELVDFSYWKCIKGLIRKNYPLYADSFILRHFRRRRRNG